MFFLLREVIATHVTTHKNGFYDSGNAIIALPRIGWPPKTGLPLVRFARLLTAREMREGALMSEPDWVYWKQIPEAKLWQCVALSCSIEPEEKDFGSRAVGYASSSDYSTMPVEFHDRLGIAISHLGSGRLMAEDNPPNIAHSRTSLPGFAAWAISLNWTVPNDFSSLAKASESESDDSLGWEGFDLESPSYPKELDIALQAWRAATIQPKVGVSPKEQIKQWLSETYPELSNVARDRIATICNWEKSGGRPKL